VTPAPEVYEGGAEAPATHHILSVLVENKAGVLSRIAGLFARRGFNIYSLAVAPAEGHDRFSRVTIVVDAASTPLEQIMGQLDKLVNVVQILDLRPRDAIERELLLATVATTEQNRRVVLDAVSEAGGSVVDADTRAVTVMLAGTPGACDQFERRLESFTNVTLHRTGRVALPRLTPTLD
jgi:acetolactate synthase-1/3 small subunit